MQRIISPALSPNTESDDVREALSIIFSPNVWQKGCAIDQAELWFRERFGTDTAVSFNSGRSALLALLRAFGIGRGDEVLIQAFTCVAVPNSILWAGAKPVFVDIDATYNIDFNDLQEKITKRSRAVVIQHTFGIPGNIDAILKVARKHNFRVIEDCAHALGGTYRGKRLGSLGDAAFFSFGRDKAVSSVWGGMAVINEKCKIKNVKLKIRKIQNTLPFPSKQWIVQQLAHPIAFSVILPTYQSGFGKALLIAFQKARLFSVPVYPEEKQGRQPSDFPGKYPNALARLLLPQLKKLDAYTQKRREAAGYYWTVLKSRTEYKVPIYSKEASWLRFPVLVGEPGSVIQRARKYGVYLGNWYHNVIDPEAVDYQAIGYVPGSCPRAEEAAGHIINLPTRIDLTEAARVIGAIT